MNKITRNELRMAGVPVEWIRKRYVGRGSMEPHELAQKAHIAAATLIRQKGYDGPIQYDNDSTPYSETPIQGDTPYPYRPTCLTICSVSSGDAIPSRGVKKTQICAPDDADLHPKYVFTIAYSQKEIQPTPIGFHLGDCEILMSSMVEEPLPVKLPPLKAKSSMEVVFKNINRFPVVAFCSIWGHTI